MKGVVLAGGNGSRMGTGELYPKASALVYNKPAIHYPLTTLRDMGCDSAVIVASPEGMASISRFVKDGADFELDVEYKVQREPNGVAGALGRVANNVTGLFPLVLGDCYYSPAPRPMHRDRPTMFWHDFPTGTEHSVWIPEIDAIFEKPRFVEVGRKAIISYIYDERVFEFIEQMGPAHNSGELEIVDIHNFYRDKAEMVEYQGFFADMGTPDGLLRAANHEAQR